MAKQKNGNMIWITGAVLGAVAGAAYALWKTPMSGQELRSKLSTGPVGQRDEVVDDKVHTPGVGEKILSKVEHTLAPVVGVELGKTANGNGVVTEPIAPVKPKPVEKAPTPPAVTSEPVAEPREPTKKVDAPFQAAEATPDPASNVGSYGSESIRAKRFAWGSPTPEAGIQPVPTDPLEEDPVTEPALAREPATPARVAPPDNSGAGFGTESIRAKRFAWGDPAPEAAAEHHEATEGTQAADQPLTDQLATAGSTISGETSPIEAVTSAAVRPGSNKRSFPKLGGLEGN